MEVKLISHDEESIELEIIGETETFLYPLRTRLCRFFPRQKLYGYPPLHDECGFRFVRREVANRRRELAKSGGADFSRLMAEREGDGQGDPPTRGSPTPFEEPGGSEPRQAGCADDRHVDVSVRHPKRPTDQVGVREGSDRNPAEQKERRPIAAQPPAGRAG